MTTATLNDVYDSLVEAAADTSDLAFARAQFDEARGRVFEDEELWESASACFLDWYLLERETGSGPPALQAAHAADAKRRELSVAIMTGHRSLFEVHKLAVGELVLFDLYGDAEFCVAERRAVHGIDIGDTMEARLVGVGGEVVLGPALFFHPPGTTSSIRRHCRRIRDTGGTRRAAMDHVASLRVRCERYGHVTPARVYSA